MRKGGNAFDVLVATESSIGSLPLRCWKSLVVVDWRGLQKKQMEKKETLDYREKAPLAATKRYVLDAEGVVIPGKHPNLPAIGVPGTIAGACSPCKLGSYHEAILKPVIELAERRRRSYAETRGTLELATMTNLK
jgi:gamma-glutamyltranspeptidase/glutathione hydrolase